MELFIQLVANGFVLSANFMLIALGFAVIFGTTRIFHFAHGGVYTVAAYLPYYFTAELHLPMSVGVVLAVAGATIVGMLLELVIYRPLRRIGASPLVMLIASMGALIILSNLVALKFGSQTKTYQGIGLYNGLEFGPITVTSLQLTTVATSTAILLLLLAFLRYTTLGRSIRAIASKPGMAEVVGIDVNRVTLVTFAIGSAVSAVGAILVGMDVGLMPAMGTNAMLIAFTTVIVGGLGSVFGAAIGAVIIGLAQSIGVWQLPTEWQSSISFGILILFIVFRPTGVLGQKLWKAAI